MFSINQSLHIETLSGPSVAIDTACSSTLQSFQLAVDAIRSGSCDAAIVAGCTLKDKNFNSNNQ